MKTFYTISLWIALFLLFYCGLAVLGCFLFGGDYYTTVHDDYYMSFMGLACIVVATVILLPPRRKGFLEDYWR